MDNYAMWEAHENELEKQLEQCPKCDYCGEYIQDDYYFDINGDIVCEECLKNKFRKRTEDYVA